MSAVPAKVARRLDAASQIDNEKNIKFSSCGQTIVTKCRRLFTVTLRQVWGTSRRPKYPRTCMLYPDQCAGQGEVHPGGHDSVTVGEEDFPVGSQLS